MKPALPRWALPAALLALLVLVSGPGAAAEPETTITVQLEDLATWRTRLAWSCRDAVLLYTERREPGPAARGVPAEWALGFGSRRLVGGRVYPTGLLRQLANPLGFLPDAGVYSEPAGLELDRAIDPGSRCGGELRLAEGRLRLLAFQEHSVLAEHSVQAGASLCLADRIELLALLGEPPARLESEQWFPVEVPYPGGLLSHGAAQLQAGTTGLDLRLSGAASGGERVRPGIWGSVGSTLRGGGWDAQLLAGACGQDYRAPGGKAVPERRLAAASLRVHPAPGMTLELRASRLLRAADDQVPALSGWRQWSRTDRVRFRVQARRLPEGGAATTAPARPHLLGPGDELLLEACAEREAGAQGVQALSGEGRLCFRKAWRAGPSLLSAELSARLSAGPSDVHPYETALGLRWRRRGRTSIGLEGEVRLEAGGELGLDCAVVLWRPGARLYCRFAALGTPPGGWNDGLSLVVGWEARTPREVPAARRASTAPGP